MINIYISIEQVQKSGKHMIDINDKEFKNEVSESNITELDKEFMQQIDNITKISGGSIVTPFGITDIYNLSTGCKTIININHILNQIGYTDYPIVDITECGENVISTIFSLIDNTRLEVLLRHSFINSIPRYKNTFNVIGVGEVNDLYQLAALIDRQAVR